MPGFVECVTHSDYCSSFYGKIRGQTGSATPKCPRHSIQLVTSVAQVVSSCPKIRRAQRCGRREQKTVLSIAKSLAWFRRAEFQSLETNETIPIQPVIPAAQCLLHAAPA
jgi:hypothetical protein